MDLRNRCTSPFTKLPTSNHITTTTDLPLPRLPAINFIHKSENSSCIQDNHNMTRFYPQPTLYLDSYHISEQQASVMRPEILPFPPYSSELHRHFTYHPQFQRLDTAMPSSNNDIHLSPTVISSPENQSNLPCLPHINFSSLNTPPAICQNDILLTSQPSIDRHPFPHNICNLGILNLPSDLQQITNKREANTSPQIQQLTSSSKPNAEFERSNPQENFEVNEKSVSNQEIVDNATYGLNCEAHELTITVNQNNSEENISLNSQSDDIQQSEESNELIETTVIKTNNVVFCKVCRKGYGSEESLDIHMRNHGPHKCPVCNKTFPRQCNLKIHMAVHAERTYSCKDCGKAFKSATSLQAHKTAVHVSSEVGSVICDACGIVLKNRKSLLQHEQIHTLGKRFACDLCDERFHRKDALNRHVVRIHVEEKFFTCQVCNTHYNTNEGLQEHLCTHETERPHQCHLCQRRFPQRSALERHIKIHSGQRPFACGICGLSFTRSHRLKAHLLHHSSSK